MKSISRSRATTIVSRGDAEPATTRIFHEGHRRAQALYANPARAERIISAMPDTASLSEEQSHFLEALPFFFLATSDGAGHMQCNFKGGGPKVLRVGDSKTLYYPEYAGNDMMLSVGNLLLYPYVGILGLCFQTRRRLKVNGRAEVLAMGEAPYAEWWSDARLVIRVHINEVIRNCSRRIPHLMPVSEPTKQPSN